MRRETWVNRRRSASREFTAAEHAVATDLRLAFPRELARSRRFGQSVSVLVAPTTSEAEERDVLATLGHHLRRYDLVGRLDGAVVVVAPDTGRDEAGALLSRLGELSPATPSMLGVAVAPEDGDELDAVFRIALDRSLTSSGGVT